MLLGIVSSPWFLRPAGASDNDGILVADWRGRQASAAKAGRDNTGTCKVPSVHSHCLKPMLTAGNGETAHKPLINSNCCGEAFQTL